MVNIADDITDFPNNGDDKKISLRNSKFPQFDYSYAKRIKEEHNDIFNAGGNEYGDTAFNNWGKVRDGQMTDTLKEWIVRRERFMERHEKDKRLAGVVAVMKWGGIVSRGESYMKEVIDEEIDKESDKGGEQVSDKEKKLIDIKEFKSRLDKDKSTDDVAIRKQFDVQVKAMDEDKRVLRFIASTKARDRDGDTIDPLGWDLTDFIKNPVFLWAHDYSVAPLGKIINYEMNDKALIEDVEFINPKEMYPDAEYSDLPEHVKFADMVYRMYKNGTLNAVSVGFDPKEYDYSQDKEGNIDFKIQSQLELSAVPVPSNQEALRVAGMKGIDKSLMNKWAKSVLKDIKQLSEPRELNYEGVESTEWDRPTLEECVNGYYIQNPDAEPESEEEIPSQVNDMPQPMRDWIASLSLLGDPQAEMFEDLLVLPAVDPETMALNENALNAIIRLAPQVEGISEETATMVQGMARELLEEEFEENMEADMYDEDEEKQNKSVDKSSSMDDFFNEIKELTKAGRTLSSANEQRLRQAKEMLDEVLDQLDNDKSKDEFVIEIEEDQKDYIEIDKNQLEKAAQKAITQLTGKIF